MNEKQIQNLILVNKLAKRSISRLFTKELCYFVKGVLIERYGTFDGYDRQEWEDENNYCEYCGYDLECGYYENDQGTFGYKEEECWFDSYAIHKHILKRFKIGELVLHQPTNEFFYQNWNLDVIKQSENFETFDREIINVIKGKTNTDFDMQYDFKPLKNLIRDFGKLLHSKREPMRKLDWKKVGQENLF